VMVKVTITLGKNNQYSSQVREQITRVVSLPSSGVPLGFQTMAMPMQPNPTNAPPPGPNPNLPPAMPTIPTAPRQ
jgi:hypothetical protein